MTRILSLFCAAAVFGFPACAPAADFNDRPPNAAEQRPAFAGQTRAPVIGAEERIDMRVIASGLDQPWGFVALPAGSGPEGWLITERPGRLRLLSPDGRISAPIRGLPAVDARGQGGLLDVTLRADFAQDRRIWWSYSEPLAQGRNATSVATGVLSADGTEVSAVKVIFRQEPGWASTKHFGSRLVFDRQGGLFVTTGDRSSADARPHAQDPTSDIGKVLRIDPDGRAEGATRTGWRAGIWSIGHRNVQAAALGPDGALWTVEHGARGGDELNRPEAGHNYGWPVISYGQEYSGRAIGTGRTQAEGMEQPLYYWDPVIAPSGMVFYSGPMFADWQGDILIGALAGQALVRLKRDGTKVVAEARYLQGLARIRDVDVAPDGAILVLTDGPDGALLRLTPAE